MSLPYKFKFYLLLIPKLLSTAIGSFYLTIDMSYFKAFPPTKATCWYVFYCFLFTILSHGSIIVYVFLNANSDAGLT